MDVLIFLANEERIRRDSTACCQPLPAQETTLALLLEPPPLVYGHPGSRITWDVEVSRETRILSLATCFRNMVGPLGIPTGSKAWFG